MIEQRGNEYMLQTPSLPHQHQSKGSSLSILESLSQPQALGVGSGSVKQLQNFNNRFWCIHAMYVYIYMKLHWTQWVREELFYFHSQILNFYDGLIQ